MKRNAQKYILAIFLMGIWYAYPAAGQEGDFTYDDTPERTPSDLTTAGSDRVYSTDNGSASPTPSYSEETPRTEKNQKKTEVTTTSVRSSQKELDEVKSGVDKSEKNKSTENAESKQEENPNSVLSFNFLHYLIQKFKLSEMAQ